ncbi:MAG: hypothetical protein LBT47_12045 [Deltaproteobacteria bacterium]|nr:hypothetical protein [Deltaproteobacteria bacterium]
MVVVAGDARRLAAAQALSQDLDLPLKRLKRAFLSYFNSEHMPGTRGCKLVEWPEDSGSLNLKGLEFRPQETKKLLNLARRLKIFFDCEAANGGVPLPERVLIIGSDGDQKAELELIELAVRENPQAAFFYQKPAAKTPPLILKALAKGNFLEPGGLPPEVARVYTVDSPLAAGYILAGLKVTVTGRPFYAGRGLTDDRNQTLQGRLLSEVELFHCLCLEGTGYEAAPTDQLRGCLAAILALSAGQCQRRLERKKINRREKDRLISSRLPGLIKRLRLSRSTLDGLFAGLKPESSPEDDLAEAALIGRAGALAYAKTVESSLKIEPGQLVGHYKPLQLKQPERMLSLTKICFERRKLELVFSLGRALLLGGQVSPEVLWLLLEALRLRFSFKEAWSLSLLAGSWFPGWRKGMFFLAASQDALLAGQPEDCLRLLAYYFATYNRAVEIPFPGPEKKLNELYGRLPWQKALTSVQLSNSGRLKLGRVKSLMYAGDFEDCLKQVEKRAGRIDYALLKARLMRLTGDYNQARFLIEKMLKTTPKATRPMIYREALTLSLSFDDNWSQTLWAEAENENVRIDEFQAWQVLSRLGQLKEAFQHHSRAPYFNQLRSYLGRRFSTDPFGQKVKQTLVLSECFLGDELRFARLYPALSKVIAAERIIFACDPRIYNLLRRSFPELHFWPVKKKVSLHFIDNLGDFDQLPGADCAHYLDNDGWKLALESDRVVTVIHTLAAFLTDYSDLEQLPDLLADQDKTVSFRAFIKTRNPGEKLIAGLSWRSSLTHYNQDRFFFSLPQLAPLLEMDDIQWVNCQYDGCTEAEQVYLDRYFPGRLLSLEGLDQYYDVDDTAAFYGAMDIMVSAGTFSAELAGCLGRPTLLFANSGELMSWARPGTSRHAFMSQVELCAGKSGGRTVDLPHHLQQKLEWQLGCSNSLAGRQLG